MSSSLGSSFLVLLIIVATMNMNTASTIHRPIEICQPGTVEKEPEGIQRICSALANSKEFSDVFSAYLQQMAEAEGKAHVAPNPDHFILRIGR